MMVLYRVLKEVHPDVGISKQGMQVMQTFAVDMFDRIMVEASRLCRISNKATLSSREIQTAGMSGSEHVCMPCHVMCLCPCNACGQHSMTIRLVL